MKIPLAGVIGCPVGHSRSPILHGTWLKYYGLRGHYVPLHVEAEDLERVLRAMPAMGFVGANVTIPHKEAALALADEASETARQIGAANTLTFRAGRILADNTDSYGFMQNLLDGAPDWQPDAGPALVLGAGGAARAVLVALTQAGAPEIFLANRTRARADDLARMLGGPIRVLDWESYADALSNVGLVVNTTSLGMEGQPTLDFPAHALRAETVVTDIVYTPLETQLLRDAKVQGCRVVDGLGMLLHQAVPGFERWFGQRPEITDTLRRAVLAQ